VLETIATSGAPGSWTEISVRVLPQALESVSDLLEEFSGGGVAVEPAIHALGPDEGYSLDASAPLAVHAYAYGPVSRARRAALRRQLRRRGLIESVTSRLHFRTLSEQDWANAWKQHYDIEKAGRVVIRPAWIDYRPKPGEIVVSLDPGMAFGTGQHPTTRMCLLAMQELMRPGAEVLDLGTGSGILAIAAVKLGAGSVKAADIEEQAIAAARANLTLNDAGSAVDVVLGSLTAVGGGSFDAVFANINAGTVIRLAPDLYARMKAGAFMLAGGVIAEREADVEAALRAAAFDVERVLSEGEWRTLVVRKAG
jgi:ribosomal protein L11 methyltransferase